METPEKNTTIIPGLISVLLPNYNTPESYLRKAIESILNQTYTQFEFIIIDDGSTNDSLSVIESYHDERIVLVKSEKNLGLIALLNKGLSLSRGEFIARIDADDISLPERFEIQIAYMRAHPEVIVSGTWIEHIGDWEKRGVKRFVKETIPSREKYRVNLLFANSPMIYHTTAMLNHRLLAEHGLQYEDDKLYAEDYKLWVSCADVAECSIIPRVLGQYRLHDNSVTAIYHAQTKQTYLLIVQDQLNKLHLTLKPEELSTYRKLQYNRKSYDPGTKEWIYKLINANNIYQVYDQNILKRDLWERWTRISYYGLMNNRGFLMRVRILAAVPLFQYPRLIHIIFDNWYKKMKRTWSSVKDKKVTV